MHLGDETVVVAVRGSLIASEDIDTDFVSKFRLLLINYAQTGRKFIIVCGGGEIARRYQRNLEILSEHSPDSADKIGIDATELNARFLIEAINAQDLHAYPEVFDKTCYDRLVESGDDLDLGDYSLLVASGWKPGRSIDYCAATIAEGRGLDRLVKLSNTDYIYNRDPEKFSIIRPIREMKWAEMKALVPERWEPGAHLPFDPRAIEKAESAGLKLAVINGRYLDEFERYLEGRSFVGTRIQG